MIIEAYDKCMEGDDMIGETNIKASSLCVVNGIDEWFPIHYKGKESGHLHLKSTWNPSDQEDADESNRGIEMTPLVVMQ